MPPAAFARDPSNRGGPAGALVIDSFAGSFVAAPVAESARVRNGQPSSTISEHEAAHEHAGARRSAQSRHPHRSLVPDEMVAD